MDRDGEDIRAVPRTGVYRVRRGDVVVTKRKAGRVKSRNVRRMKPVKRYKGRD